LNNKNKFGTWFVYSINFKNVIIMNNDMIINQIAHATGMSRKEVIKNLKEMSADPTIKRMLANKKKC
jgi:orotate phosphoribosyltransferase-like protein